MELILIGSIVVILILVLTLLSWQRNQSLKQTEAIQKWLMDSEQRNLQELRMLDQKMDVQMGSMKEKVSQDLIQFQMLMSQSMKGDFHQLNETTIQRLMYLERQVNQGILKSVETTSQAFSNVLEQMARIDETQKSLENLSQDISSLQGILTDKKTRGTFGEIQLYTLLENTFGSNQQRYKKQMKLSNGMIADCVLVAPKPLGNIVIDSKFPLENYNRMVDTALSKEDQERAKNEFRKDVSKHIKDIALKYLIPSETAEFAYMFIPAEAVFAQIVGQFDELMQLSYQAHVYIVSPTTLMAYITAIQAIYLGQERNEKMEVIQQEYARLAKEFDRFSMRWGTIEKDFERTYRDIQSVSITSGKIQNHFKQIDAVKISEEENINEIEEKCAD